MAGSHSEAPSTDNDFRALSNVSALFNHALNLGDPDRPLLYFERQSLSYRQVSDGIRQRALGLAALGIGRGDRVVVQMSNTPESIMYHLAVAEVGASYVPLNFEPSEDELA
jgi:acyl-CoA synthetase (AMP-forming)/AMP-acid ligase II